MPRHIMPSPDSLARLLTYAEKAQMSADEFLTKLLDQYAPQENFWEETITFPDNQRLMQALFDEAIYAILIANDEGQYVHVNPKATELLGYSYAELLELSIWDVTPEPNKEQGQAMWQHFLQEKYLVGDYILKTRAGNLIEVEFHATAHILPGLHMSILLDIGERKRIENELRQSQYFIEHLIKTLPYLVYVYDLAEARNIYANEEIFALLGYTETEIQSLGSEVFVKLLHPDELTLLTERLNRFKTAQDEDVLLSEIRFLHRDGYYRWLHFREVIFARNPDGTPRQVLGVAHEITQQKEIELALNISEERYRQVVEYQTDMICRYTPDFIITFANQAYCKIFGKSLEDTIGISLLTEVYPDDIPQATAHVRSLTQANPLGVSEHRGYNADGSLRWVEWIDRAIFNEVGEIIEYQGVGRDITDRKQAESLQLELLKEKELHELKSRFLSIVSHEFRTPMTVIITSTTLLRDFFEKMTLEQRTQRLDKIQTQIKHLTSLLDEVTFLNKAKAKEYPLIPVLIEDWSQVVQEVIEDIDITAPTHVPIETRIIGDAQGFISDAFLLHQILINLIGNAVKYSRADGKVLVECDCQPTKVCLSIQDTGIGIALDDQKHLFESFYRASNVGAIGGTGLGLVIVKQAVEAHHGTIEFTSALNEGTTFRVSLPTLTRY